MRNLLVGIAIGFGLSMVITLAFFPPLQEQFAVRFKQGAQFVSPLRKAKEQPNHRDEGMMPIRKSVATATELLPRDQPQEERPTPRFVEPQTDSVPKEPQAAPPPTATAPNPTNEGELTVRPLTKPPIPLLQLQGVKEAVASATGETDPGGHKACTSAIMEARVDGEVEEGAGIMPFAGKPMAASAARRPSAALQAAGGAWPALFDKSIKAFNEADRKAEADRISELPASSCSLFEGAQRDPAVKAVAPALEVALDTSRVFLAGLAQQVRLLCEAGDEQQQEQRGVLNDQGSSVVSVFAPPGGDATIVRRVAALAAAASSKCVAVDALTGVVIDPNTGDDNVDAPQSSSSSAAAALDGNTEAWEQPWRSIGPAPSEEALASIAARSDDHVEPQDEARLAGKPKLLLVYGAFRRSVNPFQAAAALRLAVAPGGRVVVAERLIDTIDNTADTVDAWRTPPDGLGFLLQMAFGAWGQCGYVSSRAASVALALGKPLQEGAGAKYGQKEWGGLKGATKKGRPTFGAFVLGTWFAFTARASPLLPPPPPSPSAPSSSAVGPDVEWDAAGLASRVAEAIGASGRGIQQARSRCVSLAPRRTAPWLSSFGRGVSSSRARGTLPPDAKDSPQSLLGAVWFTRFGWYFNLLSLLQSMPRCGRLLMVSSHESLVPSMLRSASCFSLGCRPAFDGVDWPKMDIQRLDDALESGYIPGGEGAYDMVVLDQVLEHVPHVLRAADSVRRLLKPGGAALIAMPSTNPVHHGPLDMWRAQLDAMLVVGAAVGRIDGCGTAVSNGLQAELADRYPDIYHMPLKRDDLLRKAAEAGDIAGAAPVGAMASTSWVMAIKT